MPALVIVLVLLMAAPAHAQATCEEQVAALTHSINSFIAASRAMGKAEEKVKRLQTELDKQKAKEAPKPAPKEGQ
jgi:hypothetical protein